MMNKRFLINTTAALVVVLLLVWFARSMDTYQPAGARPGDTSAEVATPEPVAEAPAAGTPSDLASPPGSDLASAAALVRRAEVGFRTPDHLAEHFQKHGAEFAGISVDGYLLLAQSLRDRPAGGDVLERVRKDGVITRFDRASGSFLAFDRDFTIRTFFRPNDGESYFLRQSLRD